MPKTNRPHLKKYWDVEASTTPEGNASGELYLYGLITDEKWWEEDVTPHGLVTELKALGSISELNVHIFSNGGDVFSGNAIYSLLKQRKEPVNVYIEGIAASIASVIAMAGDKVYIASNAMFMVHNPMLFLFGLFNKIDMAKYIADLDRVRDVTMQAYTDKTGIPPEEIHALLDANEGDGTYLSASEAIELGFADAITPDAKAPLDAVAMIRPNVYSCRGREIDLSMYKNAPKLTAAVRKAKEGVSNMPNAKRKKTVAQRKFRAELMPVECPHCNTMLNFDTETETVHLNPAEDATVAVPLDGEVEAVRRGNGFKNTLYKLVCPECGGEFDYETEPQAGEVTVDEPTFSPDEPLLAKRVKAAKAAKAKRTARVTAVKPKASRPRMQTEEITLTCTECGTDFPLGVDAEIVEAVVECPSCGAQLTVDTSNVGGSGDGADIGTDTGSDTSISDPTTNPDEEEVIVAYRNGVKAERRRLMLLDERQRAFPQFSDAIDGFKQNGTSVETANNWIFQALASRKNQNYSDAVRRDAAPLNKLGGATRANSNAAQVQDFKAYLNKARGVRTNA